MVDSFGKSYRADYIVIGAGIFGLYAAKILSAKKNKVIILEQSQKPFSRASSINQARVHNGYHYPRSYETAKKVADYYERFKKDFAFAINTSFKHVYAISCDNSKTGGDAFMEFCSCVNIPLEKIPDDEYFKPQKVEVSFIVDEPAFNFIKIRDFLTRNLNDFVQYIYGAVIQKAQKSDSDYILTLADGTRCIAPKVINATYAGINRVISLFQEELFDLKYELCEVVFCNVSANMLDLGITVMDGDYFSVMPFGNGKIHSLTSVGHTPHKVCYGAFPEFAETKYTPLPCEMHHTRSCVLCAQSQVSAWKDMRRLYKKYMKSCFKIDYKYSMFEIKPILMESENDDSRPTIIKQHTVNPSFTSVFSGKISTIYDLEKYL